jgi:hypothetical protein
MTKGVGLLVGPVVAGGAIDIASPVLEETEGYGVLWPVCAVPVLAAIPLVYRLMHSGGQISGKAATGP